MLTPYLYSHLKGSRPSRVFNTLYNTWTFVIAAMFFSYFTVSFNKIKYYY